MKELIGTAIFIVSLFGAGSFALREVHNAIRHAALENVAHGLPSLTKMTQSLRGENSHKKHLKEKIKHKK